MATKKASASASSGPVVEGRVDEASGTVSVGVVVDGCFLTVASGSLAYAKSLAAPPEGEDETYDPESEDEG